MSGREIIESVEFAGSQMVPRYTETEGGQLVTPEFLALIQNVLSGRLQEMPESEALDPEVKALAEELSVIHLPAWQRGAGTTADPTVTGIKQAARVAEYLVRRGVRVHPELEEIRWTPTPGGQPGAFDTGLHIHRDENGHWPVPDPDSFYDVDDIDVTQVEDGTWCAVHPRGLAFEAPTKSEAYAGMLAQLRVRIEQARSRRD
ncbi:hypothetical protein [Nocardia bovistercoris]|uniref:Uncharacterized protein n=1 Tax=Nocardia bovistercoris TaxID=2785916 RepID=A0A931I9S8_9NOCA|nr:hypothetical protein [Nocardia bovistercoris]MBH0776996.1 hypothetical protein [Nocardia bovistercoris]